MVYDKLSRVFSSIRATYYNLLDTFKYVFIPTIEVGNVFIGAASNFIYNEMTQRYNDKAYLSKVGSYAILIREVNGSEVVYDSYLYFVETESVTKVRQSHKIDRQLIIASVNRGNLIKLHTRSQIVKYLGAIASDYELI